MWLEEFGWGWERYGEFFFFDHWLWGPLWTDIQVHDEDAFGYLSVWMVRHWEAGHDWKDGGGEGVTIGQFSNYFRKQKPDPEHRTNYQDSVQIQFASL